MILGKVGNILDYRPRKGGYGECKAMHSQDALSSDLFDTSVFSTSPWNCDPIFSTDLSPFPGLDLRNGLDVLGFPPDSVNMDDGFGPSSYSTSPTHSNGSEGDIFSSCQLDQHLSVDYNSAVSTRFDQLFLSQFSDDESLIDHTEDSVLKYTTDLSHSMSLDNGLSNDSSSDIFPSLPCSPVQQRKRRRTKDPLSNSISWSGMTSEERLETVDAITRIISQQMGLREQLEVIKIIDPLALISPTDTEFAIDLDCLNDEKLGRIREYVKQHVTDLSEHTRQESSSTQSSTSLTSPNSSSTSNPHSKGRTRRKMSEAEKLELKVWRQRQRKKQKQQKKETQSGLFACEEVISVTLPTRDEDIDIDILD